MSGFKSLITSDRLLIVESLAVGKNSQFHVIISSPSSVLIEGTSQSLASLLIKSILFILEVII